MNILQLMMLLGKGFLYTYLGVVVLVCSVGIVMYLWSITMNIKEIIEYEYITINDSIIDSIRERNPIYLCRIGCSLLFDRYRHS